MRNLLRLTMLIAFLFGSTSALATTYRLDFGGQTSTGSYSGYLLLDYSVPDVNPDPTRGRYNGLVTGLDITINGFRYTSLFGAAAPILSVVLDETNSFGDVFGIGGGFTNEADDYGFFAIQFQRTDGSIFGSDALPTSLDLTDFDPFDVTNTNSTGVIFETPDSGALEFTSLDFAELYPVPLPAGLWLFASAIGVAFRLNSKS